SLPNSPGLVGQFHLLTKLGLSLYLPEAVVDSQGLAYALLLHGIQTVWYIGAGTIAMLYNHTSFAELVSPAASSSKPSEVSASQ
ncbi:MAG: UPF0104 family protein, partial [Pseudomonadota bacterium]